MMGNAGKIYCFWASAIPGLEEIAREEMREGLKGVRFDQVENGRDYTRLFFTFERSPQALLKMRSIDGVYAVLASINGITVGMPGLERIKRQLAKVDMESAKRLAHSLDGSIDVDCAQINATVQGNHRFRAADLLKEAQHVFAREHGMKAAAGKSGLRLQIQVKGRSALLGMRLPNAQGEPNRAMAYCLGHLLGIEPGDQVLWLRRESAEAAELHYAFGADVWVGLPANSQGLRALGDRVFCAGPELPIAAAAFSHVLAHHRATDSLAILSELARILPSGGIAVVEVEKPEPFVAALRGHAFDIAAALPVHSRGRKRILFVLERLPDEGLLQVSFDV
jgi:hypothetical protein